jgi:hypothetical protein
MTMIFLYELDFSLLETQLKSYSQVYQEQSSITLPLAKR